MYNNHSPFLSTFVLFSVKFYSYCLLFLFDLVGRVGQHINYYCLCAVCFLQRIRLQDDNLYFCSELGGMRDSVPDSPIADALLALKHAVVHSSNSASNWIGQPSYSTHCSSPTSASSYQSTSVFSTCSPIYDRSAPTSSPTQPAFPFASSHHHHHLHQHQHPHYHSTDNQDSASPASARSSSMYAGGTYRPIYRRDIRDLSFGSSHIHDTPGLSA